MTVPIINLEPFLHGNAVGKTAVPDEIARACTEIGFFVVVGHGVSKSLSVLKKSKLTARYRSMIWIRAQVVLFERKREYSEFTYNSST